MKSLFSCLSLLAASTAFAQYYPPTTPPPPICRQVMVCNPGQPCQFVTVCN